LNRLAAIVVVLLIGGTAAAFAYTQGLKQTKSPIVATKVTKQFSRFAHIDFGLRRDDHVSIEIVDSHGDVVRTLVADRAVSKGYRGFTWDGRADGGTRLPDDVYKARVELQDADRTIDLPNRIVLDTVPPRVTGASARRVGRNLVLRYRFDGQARALLFVGSKRIERTFSYKPVGTIKIPLLLISRRGASGAVAVGAEDLAGNVSKLRVLKLHILSVRVSVSG
jgi:FlgD Ig-like domain